MMTVTYEGRTFVLEVRGPLRSKWNPVDRDADEKAGTDLIAKVLTDKDAVRRMGSGEVVTARIPGQPDMEFRFSLPAGVPRLDGETKSK
jgi:hypothetical protein